MRRRPPRERWTYLQAKVKADAAKLTLDQGSSTAASAALAKDLAVFNAQLVLWSSGQQNTFAAALVKVAADEAALGKTSIAVAADVAILGVDTKALQKMLSDRDIYTLNTALVAALTADLKQLGVVWNDTVVVQQAHSDVDDAQAVADAALEAKIAADGVVDADTQIVADQAAVVAAEQKAAAAADLAKAQALYVKMQADQGVVDAQNHLNSDLAAFGQALNAESAAQLAAYQAASLDADLTIPSPMVPGLPNLPITLVNPIIMAN